METFDLNAKYLQQELHEDLNYLICEIWKYLKQNINSVSASIICENKQEFWLLLKGK